MEEKTNTALSAPEEEKEKTAADNGGASSGKPAKGKKKADKSSARADRKEQARLKKEWEDSIVASKRVKREEARRKFKKAMVLMLVFALTITSVVYVMLLFIQENNVRITAKSQDEDKSLSLSIDNSMWTPYLNANGPNTIWDVSYNRKYGREKIDTVEEVRALLDAPSVTLGELNGTNFIRFVFMVKNTGKSDANIAYEMTLDYDDRGLQNAVRVMWGMSFKSDDLTATDRETSVEIFASRSNNSKLEDTNINMESTPETGYREYVAYPQGSDLPNYDLTEYEKDLTGDKLAEAIEDGYFAATPFDNDKFVFQRNTTLQKDDIMYCYVCIWLEGSDFDCVNDALGGFVKMGVNFTAF